MASHNGRSKQNYLQENSIPQLFEGLMTGIIYNQPSDPIQFLENAIIKLKQNPDIPLKWDTFINISSSHQQQIMNVEENSVSSEQNSTNNAKPQVTTAAQAASFSRNTGRRSPSLNRNNKKNTFNQNSAILNNQINRKQSGTTNSTTEKASSSTSSRPTSLAKAVNNVFIVPDAPIILFMGGPGGGKTRYATQLAEQLKDEGLVHICMPDLIRTAISRYKDKRPEWRAASELHKRGELIPNELAQQLVIAELGKYPNARAFFLEGFPREAHQVEEFEKNVRAVDMALILDYDEEVLRHHMQEKGILSEVIDRRINEFKEKTLPIAKYFDDQQLLHLIPGERSDSIIIERMKKLTLRAINAGVGGLVTTTSTTSGSSSAIGDKNKEINQITMNGEIERKENATPILPINNNTPTSTISSFQQQKLVNSKPSTPQRPPTENEEKRSLINNGSRKSTPAPPPPPLPSSISSSPIIKNSIDEMNYSFPKGLPSEVPVILIIGAPGSNKSIFAQRISRKYEGFVLLSMGELLREFVGNFSIQHYMNVVKMPGAMYWKDDEEGIVRVRLALFKLNTLPMLKHLDDQGLLRVVSRQPHEHDPAHSEHQVEGDTDEEKVFHEICAIIDNTIFVHGMLLY
ncbi:hypothetical protein Mgra_00008807 [Meloidogyne graminicola]|uniref:Uncharacterized protein n=1 Tax=Meloidogyne graminicola TaxID=189291 RepID=A0A8S9ZEN4_9BILA|nr:hypothetical protein Mgra_00008807 [Meloidogyne graminicola]